IIVFIYYFIIYKTIKNLFQRKYLWLIILSFVLIIHHNISYFDSSLKIYFIDVGQGDSILIKLPNQKGNVLIDTGGKLDYQEDWQRKNKPFSLAKNNLIPFFKSLGITKIDSLIITHGDADHIGESIDLVNNYKIDKVYLNDFQLTSLEKRLIKIYQTAIQGTITIEIVNQQMKVTPYLDL
ncbi:MAG: MBL fold metallo-hydrolase, partial [Bacilli bacterium]